MTEILRPVESKTVTAVLLFKDGRVANVEACVDAGVLVFQDTRVTPSFRAFRFRSGRLETPPVFEEVDVQFIAELPAEFWTPAPESPEANDLRDKATRRLRR